MEGRSVLVSVVPSVLPIAIGCSVDMDLLLPFEIQTMEFQKAAQHSLELCSIQTFFTVMLPEKVTCRSIRLIDSIKRKPLKTMSYPKVSECFIWRHLVPNLNRVPILMFHDLFKF